MSEDPTVEIERHDRVAVVRLVDRERRNALSLPLVAQIVAAFDELEGDDAIGAVVVTGAPPAFCSGADTTSLGKLASTDDAAERGSIVTVYDAFLRVLGSSLPTIAAVDGPAVGAGFNLALACDLRVVGPTARFESRFLRIGLHPGGGHMWMLERAVGPQAAAACVLFGEPVGATKAVELGLAWSSHPADDLLDAAIALGARAAATPEPLVARTKESLSRVPWQPDFEAAVATELEAQTWSLSAGFFTRRPKP
ncbi:MAG TPA: enoyl-CoA hydratase-related protein [Acidimicrobiia bacterium]